MSGGTKRFVDEKLRSRPIFVFGKSADPDCRQVKRIFDRYFLSEDSFEWLDIEKRQDCRQIENYLHFLSLADRRQCPSIFINQIYFGSLFELNISDQNGSLKQLLTNAIENFI